MDSFDPGLTSLFLLILAALIAGYIDTLVGGGGLITIPALMAAGLPPIVALGTNKLQAVAGSGTATLSLLLQQKINIHRLKWLMFMAFLGALLGATLVQFIDASVLEIIIPIVLCIIALYFIFSAKQSLEQRSPAISAKKYGLTVTPAIGVYDGMFGPGTGSFFVWAGVALQGQSIVNATMVAKSLNFATNLSALLVFACFGKIAWMVGISMMIGQALGARLGVHSLLRVHPNILRFCVIILCAMILIWWYFQRS